ncbi:hypothetical protein I553_1621 [Mycobacterium xenopi 4042]|uniref:Uncharacterized protein n=1 Tax=Mycobacterium xenopi 4042 TaxID=1299334 RepID=X8CEF3_MYCXE|nr:hypothetical protein I553_1621 [Mycobacterium xenopi 4042]
MGGFAGDAAGPVGGQEHETPRMVFGCERDVERSARGEVAGAVGVSSRRTVSSPRLARPRRSVPRVPPGPRR